MIRHLAIEICRMAVGAGKQAQVELRTRFRLADSEVHRPRLGQGRGHILGTCSWEEPPLTIRHVPLDDPAKHDVCLQPVLAAIPESNKPNRRLSDDCTYSLESVAGSGNSPR